ncbi:MAG: hypothetical protein KBT12_07995 [Bacteroidales bacterium]|nr:hypothetical protein [Candidatus Physcousia equi]
MKNIYHNDILSLLMLRGEKGLQIAKLTRMVFNLHTSLFDRAISYSELHRSIRLYLWRQARQRRSPFMRVGYGCYAVRPNVAVQLNLCFNEKKEASAPNTQEEKKSEEMVVDARQLQLEF